MKNDQNPARQTRERGIAWESTTVGYIKYVTDERYQKFSDEVKRWYKPYRCSHCEARVRGTISDACVAIADQVEPDFRGKSKSCTSQSAKRWQAAYDGAAAAIERAAILADETAEVARQMSREIATKNSKDPAVSAYDLAADYCECAAEDIRNMQPREAGDE